MTTLPLALSISAGWSTDRRFGAVSSPRPSARETVARWVTESVVAHRGIDHVRSQSHSPNSALSAGPTSR